MIYYDDCLNKRTTFKVIFEQAEECGISSSIDDGPANEILHSISQTHFDPVIKKKISFITVTIDFFKMCKEIKKGNINDYIVNNIFEVVSNLSITKDNVVRIHPLTQVV